jgi:hypothetical protein
MALLKAIFLRFASSKCWQILVIPTGLEPVTVCLAYPYGFRRSRLRRDLWSGLSLRHRRRVAYSLYGAFLKPRRIMP